MDNDEARQGERVTIMTIHAAKGLEFDIVYLPGWEEGVFPSQRAMDEGGLAGARGREPPGLRRDHPGATQKRQFSTPPTAESTASGRAPSQRFIAELPKAEIEEETTITFGESLWRAQWSERADPFAHVARPSRGPGWQRARPSPTIPNRSRRLK